MSELKSEIEPSNEVDLCPKIIQDKLNLDWEIKTKLTSQNLWSEKEHILYILFLEKNKDKAKSKLIRRYFSNYLDLIHFLKRCPCLLDLKQGFNAEGTTKNMNLGISFLIELLKKRKKD